MRELSGCGSSARVAIAIRCTERFMAHQPRFRRGCGRVIRSAAELSYVGVTRIWEFAANGRPIRPFRHLRFVPRMRLGRMSLETTLICEAWI